MASEESEDDASVSYISAREDVSDDDNDGNHNFHTPRTSPAPGSRSKPALARSFSPASQPPARLLDRFPLPDVDALHTNSYDAGTAFRSAVQRRDQDAHESYFGPDGSDEDTTPVKKAPFSSPGAAITPPLQGRKRNRSGDEQQKTPQPAKQQRIGSQQESPRDPQTTPKAQSIDYFGEYLQSTPKENVLRQRLPSPRSKEYRSAVQKALNYLYKSLEDRRRFDERRALRQLEQRSLTDDWSRTLLHALITTGLDERLQGYDISPGTLPQLTLEQADAWSKVREQHVIVPSDSAATSSTLSELPSPDEQRTEPAVAAQAGPDPPGDRESTRDTRRISILTALESMSSRSSSAVTSPASEMPPVQGPAAVKSGTPSPTKTMTSLLPPQDGRRSSVQSLLDRSMSRSPASASRKQPLPTPRKMQEVARASRDASPTPTSRVVGGPPVATTNNAAEDDVDPLQPLRFTPDYDQLPDHGASSGDNFSADLAKPEMSDQADKSIIEDYLVTGTEAAVPHSLENDFEGDFAETIENEEAHTVLVVDKVPDNKVRVNIAKFGPPSPKDQSKQTAVEVDQSSKAGSDELEISEYQRSVAQLNPIATAADGESISNRRGIEPTVEDRSWLNSLPPADGGLSKNDEQSDGKLDGHISDNMPIDTNNVDEHAIFDNVRENRLEASKSRAGHREPDPTKEPSEGRRKKKEPAGAKSPEAYMHKHALSREGMSKEQRKAAKQEKIRRRKAKKLRRQDAMPASVREKRAADKAARKERKQRRKAQGRLAVAPAV